MPELSVLVPLEDPRGDVADHLRTWTHEQSLARERFQVVVASTGEDPEGEARIEELLAPHDVFERAPGVHPLELWNVAAARADSDWLFLTEAHCEGDPACLAAVARSIEEAPGRDALTFRAGHITLSQTGAIGARWFDSIYEDWERPGEWPRLNLTGFAIRRRTFEEAGGLETRYGLFCAPLLSARVLERGADVGFLTDARVLHIQPEEIREHHGYSADYARGECEARLREDRVFCERYFGPGRVWTNRLRYQPAIARHAVRVLADSAARAAVRRRGDLRWLVRELAARLPAALSGIRPHLAWARLLFLANEAAVARVPLSPDLGWRTFLRAQELVVEQTQLAWVEERGESVTPPEPWQGERPVEMLGHQELVGVYGLESHESRRFRWTEPVTMVRLAPRSRGQQTLRIDTGGLRGDPLDSLRAVYVNGRRVAWQRLRSEGGTLVVPLGPEAKPATVVMLWRPFEPRRSGSDDPRRLGITLFSIAL